MIAPGWYEKVDSKGNIRIKNEKDLHRTEIGLSLEARCAKIPVLIKMEDVPEDEEMPEEISKLFEYNVHKLRWQFADAHRYELARFIDVINQHLR